MTGPAIGAVPGSPAGGLSAEAQPTIRTAPT